MSDAMQTYIYILHYVRCTDAKKYAKLQCSTGKATQFELGKNFIYIIYVHVSCNFQNANCCNVVLSFPPSTFGVQ